MDNNIYKCLGEFLIKLKRNPKKRSGYYYQYEIYKYSKPTQHYTTHQIIHVINKVYESNCCQCKK